MYRATAVAVTMIATLGVAGALLPTRVDDALRNYLVMAQLIAHEGRVTFQAANPPMFGLFPLGQELHWAALLLVGNTASAAVFDALGSAATLAAIAVLAAAFGAHRRVQVLAVAIVATMPAYATLVGVLKVDNAATAFGVMAFAALAALGPTAARRPAERPHARLRARQPIHGRAPRSRVALLRVAPASRVRSLGPAPLGLRRRGCPARRGPELPEELDPRPRAVRAPVRRRATTSGAMPLRGGSAA